MEPDLNTKHCVKEKHPRLGMKRPSFPDPSRTLAALWPWIVYSASWLAFLFSKRTWLRDLKGLFLADKTVISLRAGTVSVLFFADCILHSVNLLCSLMCMGWGGEEEPSEGDFLPFLFFILSCFLCYCFLLAGHTQRSKFVLKRNEKRKRST